MKKISLIIVCALALFFVSCQTADNHDKNGDTPTTVVEKMYKHLMMDDYIGAADYCKIPDSVKPEVYDKYFNDNAELKGMAWKEIVIAKMKQSSDCKLIDFEVVAEEVSKTDPNNATVKTKITVKKGENEAKTDCSFPLKRDENVWKIIG